jgi:hypothetical protein
VIAAVPLAAAVLAVSAWPARVVVAAPGRATIHVNNPGDGAVVVDTAASGYALDLRGRPRVMSGRRWLHVRPARLRLQANGSADLEVTVARPNGAAPGDHAALVLLATESPGGRRVVARLRLGVVVVARVPGLLVRRIALGGLRVARRARITAVDVAVVNRGNVDEWIGARRLSLRLYRGGVLIATLWAAPRRLLARSPGLVRLTSRRRVSGPVRAIVQLTRPRDGVAVVRRTLRLRL